MNFETKVEIGKSAYQCIANGSDIKTIMEPLILTCALDTVANGEETDPLEVLILGMNEYTIDSYADALTTMIKEKEDIHVLQQYKDAVSQLSKGLKESGKEDVIGNFLPANTLLGMALCKAGEKLMRGE